MIDESIHLEKRRETHGFNLLLLLLPIITFALTLAILVSAIANGKLAQIAGPNILGEKTKAAQTEVTK